MDIQVKTLHLSSVRKLRVMVLSAGLKPITEKDWSVPGEASLDRFLNYMYGPDMSVHSMKLFYFESQMMTIALKIGYQHHILNNKNKKGDP